jgi:DNA modification methylase
MPIWDKENAGLGTGFRAQHECILHFSIDTPAYFSFDFGNLIRAPRMPSDRHHPTEKPVSIMSALVKVQSARGDVVLDPFMGSGSTGVAAVKLGRKFIGIEANPQFFDTACRRIEEAAKTADLFDEPAPKPVQESLLGDAA